MQEKSFLHPDTSTVKQLSLDRQPVYCNDVEWLFLTITLPAYNIRVNREFLLIVLIGA